LTDIKTNKKRASKTINLAKGSGKIILISLLIIAVIFVITTIYPTNLLLILRWPLLMIFVLIIWFFRDPKRQIPDAKNCILSPADGKIISIASRDGKNKVAIYMSLFNVHVNRSPINGKVSKKEHSQGQYLPAFNANSHLKNEQTSLTINNKDIEIKVVQIAGLIARKIVNYVNPGKGLKAGQRYGLIKFGSRVDLEFPDSCKLLCNKGDKVRAGETIIAKINGADK